MSGVEQMARSKSGFARQDRWSGACAGRPESWVSRSATVTAVRSAPRQSGTASATRISRSSAAASTSRIASVVVASTLVSDARSKTVAGEAPGAEASPVSRPAASCQTTPSASPISATAHGATPDVTASRITRRVRGKSAI